MTELLQELRVFIQNGEYSEIIDLLNSSDNIAKTSEEYDLMVRTLVSFLEPRLEDFNQKIMKIRFTILIFLIKQMMSRGDMENFDVLYNKIILPMDQDIDITKIGSYNFDLNLLGFYLNKLGQLFSMKGRYEKAVYYFDKSYIVRDYLGDTKGSAAVVNNLAICMEYSGELSKARDYFLKNVDLFEQLGDYQSRAMTYNNLSMTFSDLGQYNEAIKYGLMALNQSKQMGLKAPMFHILNNIGMAYFMLDDLESALSFFKGAYKAALNPHDRLLALGNTAYYHTRVGNHEVAFEIASEVAKSSKQLSLEVNEAIGLSGLILASIHLRKFDKAKSFLKRLEYLSEINQEERIVKQFYILSGIIKLRSERLGDKSEGYNQLKAILNQYNHLYDDKLTLLFSICDYLMFEYEVLGNQDALDELVAFLENLKDLAEKSHQVSTKIKLLLLESRVLVLMKDFETPLKLLNEAEELGSSNNLFYLSVLIAEERDKFLRSLRNFEAKRNQFNSTSLNYVELKEKTKTSNLLSESLIDVEILGIQIDKSQSLSVSGKVYRYTKIGYENLFDEHEIREIISSLMEGGEVRKTSFKELMILETIFEGKKVIIVTKGNSYVAQIKLEYITNLLRAENIIHDNHEPIEDQVILENILKNLVKGQPESLDMDDQASEPNSEFKDLLLHPVRFEIMRILDSYLHFPRKHLMKILNISSGSLQRHLKHLENGELLELSYAFEGGNTIQIVYLTDKGLQAMNEFKQSMQ